MKLGHKDSKGPRAGDVPGVAQGRTLGLSCLWLSMWSWEAQTHSLSSLSPPAPTQGCSVLIMFPMVPCDYSLGSQQVDIMKSPTPTMPGLLGWTASSQTTSPKNFSPLSCFVSGIWSKRCEKLRPHSYTHVVIHTCRYTHMHVYSVRIAEGMWLVFGRIRICMDDCGIWASINSTKSVCFLPVKAWGGSGRQWEMEGTLSLSL